MMGLMPAATAADLVDHHRVGHASEVGVGRLDLGAGPQQLHRGRLRRDRGGALAIGVADRLMMLQYSIYSVISPEGCASILWKSADRAEDAAEAMGVTADRLKDLGLVDEVLREPLGGAHRDPAETNRRLKEALQRHLKDLADTDMDELLARRYKRIMGFGRFKE